MAPSNPSQAIPAGDEAAFAAMLQDAIARFQRDDFTGAAQVCQRVLDRNPFYAPALHAMGWIQFRQGQVEHAVASLAQAAATAPDVALYSADLGRLLVQIQRFDHAVDPLKRAAELEPSAGNLCDYGYALNAMGRLDEAEAALQRALKLDARNVAALFNLGAVRRSQGKPALAADHYAAAAKLAPQLFEAHLFEGLANAEAGHFDRAERAFERALKMRSDAPLLHDLGTTLVKLKQPLRGLPYLRRAVQAAPQDVTQHDALAAALIEAGQFAEAETVARQAVALQPAHADAHVNLAAALHRQGKYADAVQENRRALELNPSLARARANLAEALSLLGRDEDAIAEAQRAAVDDPKDDIVQGVHSSVLQRAQRPHDALAVARAAAEIHPKSAIRRFNLAAALNESDEPEAAIEALQETLSLDPSHPLARVALGMIQLSRGDFREGWRNYDAREKPVLPHQLKPWEGSDLSGRPILLTVEQGFGDVIHFVRYASLVAKQRHGKPNVLCTPHLQRLLQTVPGVEHVVTQVNDPRVGNAKHAATLLDLPRLFNTILETIPAAVPYVSVPPPRDASRRANLLATIDTSTRGCKRVGLVWGGGVAYVHNRKRSIPIDVFRPIVESSTGLAFFSLLVNPIPDHDRDVMRQLNIVDLAEYLTDFAETAAAIERLDLVITVDTAVAHLAGAMAKPVWILLPRVSDWRWLRNRDDSPWYPTAKLFRQSTIGDWPAVAERVAGELQQFA